MDFNPPKVNPVSSLGKVTSKPSFSIWEAAFLVLVLGLGGMYFIKPKTAELNTKKTQLEEVSKQLADLKQTGATINTLYNQLTAETNKDALTLLDEAIPIESRPSRIYVLLENLATTAQLKVDALEVQPLSPTQNVTAGTVQAGGSAAAAKKSSDKKLEDYTITTSLVGTFDQFLTFLKLMENNPRLFSIQSVDIGGQNDKGELTFKVLMKTYSYTQ